MKGGDEVAEKDIAEKTLEGYNDVFADIANVLLFNGRRLINPDDLEDRTPNSSYKVDGKIHGQERDVAKAWRNGTIRLACIGTENQTRVDKLMPLRLSDMMAQSIVHSMIQRNRSIRLSRLFCILERIPSGMMKFR